MSNKLVYIDKFGYAVTGEKPPGGIPIGLYMKDDEEETMSEDGKTYVEGLLEDIKFLLMLQLITSGITGKQIAEILDFKKKDFVRLFPWADWEGR